MLRNGGRQTVPVQPCGGAYNDDGAAIDAYWETADYDGELFFRVKTFTGVAVRLAASPVTGVKVHARVRGIWQQVFDAKGKARYFDFAYVDFEKLSFSADKTPRTLYGKVKLKKVDKVSNSRIRRKQHIDFGKGER